MTLPWCPPPPLRDPPPAAITERQADVLAGVAQGHSNREIGARLHITEDTVKTHLRRLYRRLGVRDRAHAVALACTGQVVVKGDTSWDEDTPTGDTAAWLAEWSPGRPIGERNDGGTPARVGPGGAANAVLPALAPDNPRRIA